MNVIGINCLIFSVIISNLLFSQTKELDNYLYIADSLLNNKNYQEALTICNSNKSLINDSSIQIQSLIISSKCYASINMIDSLFLTLNKILNTGYDDIDIFIDGIIYSKIKGNKNYKWLLRRSLYNYYTNNPNIDTNITFKIIKAIINDQGIRKYYKTLESDSIAQLNCLKQIRLIDSLNTLVIIEIFKEYGYPGINMVGYSHKDDAFFIIQHADIDEQKKWLQSIKYACDNFEMSPELFNLILDRILVKERGNQYFGTQFYYENNIKRYYPIDTTLNIHTLFDYYKIKY